MRLASQKRQSSRGLNGAGYIGLCSWLRRASQATGAPYTYTLESSSDIENRVHKVSEQTWSCAGEALGLQLPVTLLYDCQSVSEMAEFIDSGLTGGDTAADAGQSAAPEGWTQHGSAINVQEPDRPSKLLKTLRCGRLHRCHLSMPCTKRCGVRR